jgi:hypothetical protein
MDNGVKIGGLDAAVRKSGAADACDSGSIEPTASFRLPLHLNQIGDPQCGSGWPYVVQHLREFHRPEGILLDDFIERSFQWKRHRQRWREPWVGIFHHPPNLPEWLEPTAPSQTIMSTADFQASLPYLRGAIALSEHLGSWLRDRLHCPVLVRRHPAAPASRQFSLERWEAQEQQRIVQIGWYARNHRAIYQVEVPRGFQKIHLTQIAPWIQRAIGANDRYSPYRNRAWNGEVRVIPGVNCVQYDYLMSSSVVLNEYWDVSASNTIIEAIARCTPILVNRHPALVEYLGADYPLFFDDLSDVRALLEDPARVRLGWKHLVEMDKSWLSAKAFAREVVEFVRKVSRTDARSA